MKNIKVVQKVIQNCAEYIMFPCRVDVQEKTLTQEKLMFRSNLRNLENKSKFVSTSLYIQVEYKQGVSIHFRYVHTNTGCLCIFSILGKNTRLTQIQGVSLHPYTRYTQLQGVSIILYTTYTQKGVSVHIVHQVYKITGCLNTFGILCKHKYRMSQCIQYTRYQDSQGVSIHLFHQTQTNTGCLNAYSTQNQQIHGVLILLVHQVYTITWCFSTFSTLGKINTGYLNESIHLVHNEHTSTCSSLGIHKNSLGVSRHSVHYIPTNIVFFTKESLIILN